MKSLICVVITVTALSLFPSCEKDPATIVETRIDTVFTPVSYPTLDSVSTLTSGVDWPIGLVFDASGNLYVANATTGAITRILPNGTKLPFASAGTNTGAIAFSPSGDLYASCYGDGTLKKVGPTGGPMSTVKSAISSPGFMAFNSTGDLFLCVHDDSVILKITPSGTETIFAKLPRPSGLVFDKSGDLLVGDQVGRSIRRITPSGDISMFVSNLPDPHTLVFDAHGNLFVSASKNNSTTISVIAPDGFNYFLPFEFTWPTGLVFDPAGKLYVANYTGGFISRVTFNP